MDGRGSPSFTRPGTGPSGAVPLGRKPRAPKDRGGKAAAPPATEPMGSPSMQRASAASPSMLLHEPPTGATGRKACRTSPHASPSMLGFSPVEQGGGAGDVPPALELPAAMANLEGVTISQGKVPVLAPVPSAPPVFQSTSLVSPTNGIGPDEAYSKDEEQLNGFLKLHPMLSLFVHACLELFPTPARASHSRSDPSPHCFPLPLAGRPPRSAPCSCSRACSRRWPSRLPICKRLPPALVLPCARVLPCLLTR